MHFFQNLIMWASGYDYIGNPKTFSLLALFSRCHTPIAQGLSKYSGPLYRSKIKVSQVPLVGTLNLCLKMPEKMQKTRNESEHPRLRKRPKPIKEIPKSKLAIFHNFFDVFQFSSLLHLFRHLKTQVQSSLKGYFEKLKGPRPF